MKKTSSLFLIGSALCLAGACGPNERILNSAAENSAERDAITSNANVAPAANSFEHDLQSMRTADFKFVLVIRRKDGKVLDAADKTLIAKSGSNVNRRRLSDEGRAVIIGSNFALIATEFDALSDRFTTENFSKPDSGPVFANVTPSSNTVNK